MYKCTECGMEYEVKPDYCDCGNDEFVLTIDEKEEHVAKPEIKQEPAIQEQHTVIQDKQVAENKTLTYNSYKMPFSPFALAIFIVCVIFSLLILFMWNPKSSDTGNTEQEVKTEEMQRNIPSIDKLWKEPTLIKGEHNKQEEQQVSQPIVVSKPVPIKTTTVKQTPKKSTTVPLTKKTTPTTTVKQAKPAQTANPQPIIQQKTAIDTEAQKAAEAAKKAAEAKQKAEAEAMLAAEKAKQASIAKQEYANYKIALRNTIGKKIDFTKVIGDGSCIVTFKLDSSGNLINRAFAQQSSNLTLNNAVYKAVMSTPNFTRPPAAYKNETLKLKISFNNGNFAIILE